MVPAGTTGPFADVHAQGWPVDGGFGTAFGPAPAPAVPTTSPAPGGAPFAPTGAPFATPPQPAANPQSVAFGSAPSAAPVGYAAGATTGYTGAPAMPILPPGHPGSRPAAPPPAAYDEHDEARRRRSAAFGPRADGPARRPAGTPLLDLKEEDTYTWKAGPPPPSPGVAGPSIAQRRVGANVIAPPQKHTPNYVMIFIVLAVVAALGMGVASFLR